MRKVRQVIIFAVAGLGLGLATVGCNSSTTTSKDMMHGETMGSGKMAGDKMGGEKMGGEKMGGDKMGGEKMMKDKPGG